MGTIEWREVNVAILGGGVAGFNAAKMATGMGANVKALDVNLHRLRYISDVLPPNVNTIMSDLYNIRMLLRESEPGRGRGRRHLNLCAHWAADCPCGCSLTSAAIRTAEASASAEPI